MRKTPEYLPYYLKHDSLYENYPQLNDVKVEFVDFDDGAGAKTKIESGQYLIQINKKLDSENVKSVVLHEVQHIVQDIESFEQGTNPSEALEYVRKKAKDELEAKDDKNYLDAKKNKQGEVFIDKYLINAYNKVYGNVNNIEDVAELAYSAFYGEREARDVQKRMDMTTEMRKNNFPSNFENEITHTWEDYNNELRGIHSKVRGADSTFGQTFNTGRRERERGYFGENSKRIKRNGGTETAGGMESFKGKAEINDFQFSSPAAEIQQDDQMYLTDEQDYDRRLYFLKSIKEFEKRMEDEGFPDYYIDKVYNQLNYAMMCGYEGDYSVFTDVLPGVDIKAVKKTVLTGDLTHIFPKKNKSKNATSKTDVADVGEKSVTNVSGKSIDKSAKSGIINIEIDKFVPCLEDAKTGEILPTEICSIKRSDLKKYTVSSGWNDDWGNRPDDEEIFGIFIKGEKEPQGLISLKYKKGGTYIASTSTAPQNNKLIVGDEQKYLGVGGHLFAVAVEQSVKNNGNGTIYGYAANSDVLNHFVNKFDAEHIPIAHKYQFIIEGQASQRLLNIYNYERR